MAHADGEPVIPLQFAYLCWDAPEAQRMIASALKLKIKPKIHRAAP